MTSLADHQSAKFTKLLYLGDSGTGKTGSLVSLVKAGYSLRIMDWDNGLDALSEQVSQQCPELKSAVDFETLRDPIRSTPVGPRPSAKAWVAGMRLLDKWSDGTVPSEWGPETIFVFDSTTSGGRSALIWAESLAPAAKDPRQWYFAAQRSFEHVIALLTDDDFQANVIVIAHINWKELEEGVSKGYPTSVGSAFGPILPRYFNWMIQAESRADPTQKREPKRVIRTIPSPQIDLKNPAPFKVEAEYPLNEGLAAIFAELRK